MTERLALPLKRAPTKLKDQHKKNKSARMLQKEMVFLIPKQF